MGSIVRRVAPKAGVAGRQVVAVAPPAPSLAGLQLPGEAKEANANFFEYVSMVYGRQGIGKTTFGASFPDAILFSCERVSPGIVAYDFNAAAGGVRDWAVFKQGVALLEKEPGRFGTVVVDTVEAAYQQCLRWVCKQHGCEHPPENDFGKTWSAIKNEFTSVLDRIWASGRGIVFTAHAKEAEFTSHSGAKFTRIQPAVAGQCFGYIKAKCDNIFYAEFVKGADGKAMRILVTEGDEVVEAKHACALPRYLPFPKDGGAALVARAFAGEDVGLEVGAFVAGKETSKLGAAMLEGDAIRQAAAKLKNKKTFKK